MLIAVFAAALSGRAQTLEIYSEFDRPDPFGGIVAVDRPAEPREILSPAVARNGFSSFHVAVTAPARESYLLYVIPNPVSACRVFLYKEHFVKTKAGWIPDTLTAIHRLPDFGVMPDPDDGVDGQTTRAYLLDLWVAPNADVARFRLEVQLKMAGWTVRPMELRVMPARVPEIPMGPDRKLPEIEHGADAAAAGPLMEYLAGTPLTMPPPGTTLRGIIRRNAVQDLGLAREVGWEALAQRALDLFQVNSLFGKRLLGAEWWLKIRDWLLTERTGAG